jgi:thiamine-monophosphate kinase
MSEEFSRIAEIRQRLRMSSAEVEIGIGDDAAVLSPTNAYQVVSVDTAVQGVHFRPEFASWPQIGYRSMVAALSDLAAMGARPRAALVALILPVEFEDGPLFELVDGLAEAAREYGSPVVGGNLSAGAELSITTTVIGQSEDAILTRSGATPHDRICVTGTIGAAALGLRCLQAGYNGPAAAPFIERWRRPTALILEGQLLLNAASASIDISDGLVQDLGHLCAASDVGAELHLGDLPLYAGATELARELHSDALDLALSGGEDYELIFTFPSRADLPPVGTCIGVVTAQRGSIALLDRQGRPVTATHTGYKHWR